MAERRKTGALPPLLIIMVKQPVMGRVKTRLAREIGLSAATQFARISARATIARLSRDRRWRTVLAVTPDTALAAPVWGDGLSGPARLPSRQKGLQKSPPRRAKLPTPSQAAPPRIGQGSGDLGERMARLLAPPSRPALLIGADIPAVSPALIADAFRLLGSNDAVFGPAEDGGYWLIGLNRRAPQRGMFAGVRWSSPHALADTLKNLPQVHIGYAQRLSDVDDAESYRCCAALAARITPLVWSPAAWSG